VDVRPASERDIDSIIDILFGEPSPETLALAGSRELAQRFGARRLRLHGFPEPTHPTVVGEIDGLVVGVLQYTSAPEADRDRFAFARLAVSVFGLWGTAQRARRFYGLSRVQFAPPAGSFYIAELHVAPAYRGRGIGSALLEWAIVHARDDQRLSLHTTTSNPARFLYERHGFRVTATRTHREYRRYTGIDGRHLMERTPRSDAAPRGRPA
jgi:ribosomal protein S18 acetylase RimI-like enzyme